MKGIIRREEITITVVFRCLFEREILHKSEEFLELFRKTSTHVFMRCRLFEFSNFLKPFFLVFELKILPEQSSFHKVKKKISKTLHVIPSTLL